MCEGAVGLHALFLELAGFVLVEAGLSVSAVGEEGALNEIGSNKEFGQVFILCDFTISRQSFF